MPDRFTPISSRSDLGTIVNQMNRNFQSLDREATTKQFKDNTGNSMLIGNLDGDQFGLSMLDAQGNGIFMGMYRTGRFAKISYKEGVPVILDGMAPDDGRIGFWIARPGENVITLLGG